MTKEKFVSLKQYKNVSIKSFKVREITGEDMIAAAARVAPMDGEEINPQLMGMMVRMETIAGSITEVNGERQIGPCGDFKKWNGRTREFVARTFKYLNEISNEESDLFDKALAASDEDVDASAVEQTGSSGDD